MSARRTILLMMILVGCQVDPYPFELEQFNVPNGGVKVMVIGDWGRADNVNLKANAHMMELLACRHTIDAVLTTGDNFYESGVSGVDDPYWNISFETIFNGQCIAPIPWFPTLGNHDERGNSQAQIDYSLSSDRWNMPSNYYDQWLTGNDSVSVHFVAVDTSPFVNEYYSNPESSNMGSYLAYADTAAQLLWLDSVLAAGEPDWLVVYGHHPVYAANGRHGSTQELIDKFVPLFDARGVDIYFCGHNHSLELIKTESSTLYVTSGGGSTPQETIENLDYNLFGVAQSGFVLSSFTQEGAQLDFVGSQGQRLFTYFTPRTP